jgi:hypothetical protein
VIKRTPAIIKRISTTIEKYFSTQKTKIQQRAGNRGEIQKSQDKMLGFYSYAKSCTTNLAAVVLGIKH